MSLGKDLRDFRYFFGKVRRHSSGLKALQYFRDWQNSLENDRSPLTDEVPWVTFSAINKLREILKSEFVAFEFGGGGSTLFLSRHVKDLTTAEHDPMWFQAVVDKMTSLGRNNWRGHILPPENGPSESSDYSDPDKFLSRDENFRGMSFEKYATSIDKFPDDHFDFVMVDGRARPSCIKHSLPKLKPGGYLVIDNSDRDYYLSKIDLNEGFSMIFNDFGPGPYSSEFSQTTIWQRK